jgi:hypothetical protein
MTKRSRQTEGSVRASVVGTLLAGQRSPPFRGGPAGHEPELRSLSVDWGVTRDTDRDFIMTAEQAREYGIVDDIITARDGSLTRGASPART